MKLHTALHKILKSKITFVLFAFFFLFLFHGTLKANAATYYVAPGGSNAANGTSLGTAWQTLEHAASQIVGGDDVYVRAGTYNLTTTLNLTYKYGTIGNPTTFQAYNNETVIIDGKNLTLSDDQAIVLIGVADYLYFEGFEVTDSRATPQGRGITLFDDDSTGDYIYIRNNKIHNTKMQAVNLVGEYIYLENNEIYDAAMANVNQSMNGGQPESGGWPVAIATFYEWGNAELSRNIFIRNNYVHHNWGEGIAPLYSQYVEISGNRVNDNYGVNIYLADTQDANVFNNIVYSADTTRDRTLPVGWGGHATGISFANEIFYNVGGGTPALAPTNNLFIYNNILANNSRAINYFNDPLNTQTYNTYGNVRIFNNIIYRDPAYDNDAKHAIFFYDVPSGYTQPFGTNQIVNNIIYSGGASLDQNLSMHSSDLGYWTFSNNDWVNGIPSIGTQTNSISADPLFVSPNIGGSTTGFRVFSNSPVINAGTNTSGYTDYAGVARDSSPNLGIFEAQQALPTATPTPTSTPIPTSTPTSIPAPTATSVVPTTISSTSGTPIPTEAVTITTTVTNTPTESNTPTPTKKGILANTGSNSVKISLGAFILIGVLILIVRVSGRKKVISLGEK